MINKKIIETAKKEAAPFECEFVHLLKKETISPSADLDELCHHEEECKIVSRLIEKHKKEKPELALILTLKLEKFKNDKLPKGRLQI